MIKLFDGWQIDTDPCQYVLHREMPYKTKDGKDNIRFDGTTYHATLEQAFNKFCRELQRNAIGAKEYDVDSAVKAINAIHDKVQSLFKEAVQ